MIFFQKNFTAKLVAIAMVTTFSTTNLLAFMSADQPKNGISDMGNLIAVWSVYDQTTGDYVVRSRTWDVNNGWSSNTTISATPGTSSCPSIIVNNAGDAAVLWTTLDQNNIPTIQGRIYYNGAWDVGPTQISAEGEAVIMFEHKLNNNGDISVIWSSFPPNSSDSAIYTLTGSTVAAGWNTDSGITKISD